jgi:hypothetical protein
MLAAGCATHGVFIPADRREIELRGNQFQHTSVGRAYAIRLEALFAERDGDRIMSQGLRPYPDGWRAHKRYLKQTAAFMRDPGALSHRSAPRMAGRELTARY